MIDYLKAHLVPKGSADIIYIFIDNPYYRGDFIRDTIAYFEKKLPLVKIGIEELTPSDIFTLQILKDSCYFTEEGYQQWLKENLPR